MTKDKWAKGLAIIGNVLVWVPVLAPVVFSLRGLLSGGVFNFDFLMPAELFPVVAVGALLLLGAAILARKRVKWFAWCMVIALVLLFGGQALAVVTGLATGEIEPTGWPWIIVLGAIIGYALVVVAIGIGGVLLVRDLFARRS